MLRLVLRGVRARKLRSALTAIAILLGVAMIAGTFVITDQITAAFADIFRQANKGTDAVVYRKAAFDTQQGGSLGGPLPESYVRRVQDVAGVSRAEGFVQASGGLVVDGKLKE